MGKLIILIAIVHLATLINLFNAQRPLNNNSSSPNFTPSYNFNPSANIPSFSSSSSLSSSPSSTSSKDKFTSTNRGGGSISSKLSSLLLLQAQSPVNQSHPNSDTASGGGGTLKGYGYDPPKNSPREHNSNTRRSKFANKMMAIRQKNKENEPPSRPSDIGIVSVGHNGPAFVHGTDVYRVHQNYSDTSRQHDSPNAMFIPKDPVRKIKEKFQTGRYQRPPYDSSEIEDVLGVKCTFETECAWGWDEDVVDGFQIVTGANLSEANKTGIMPGPLTDSKRNANGHFLHLRIVPETDQRTITSPLFSTTLENCYLEIFLHQSAMSYGRYRIVIVPHKSQNSSWVSHEMSGNDFQTWENYTFTINRVSKDFNILFEVVPGDLDGAARGHVSIDNLRMRNCFPETTNKAECDESQIKCYDSNRPVCIKPSRICDIDINCDESEDELSNCDKIPYGGRCDFEKKGDWCGWYNSGKAIMSWTQHSGPTPTDKTGPESDHTFENYNSTGQYMFVNMNQHANDSEKKRLVGFASNAVMNSVVFNPPPSVHSNISSPYRNSCMVRFYVHQYGYNAGSINLSVVEMREKENVTTTLWWSSKNLGAKWIRVELDLPNITTKYFLQLEARMGMRIYSDVAIDDFSLSPECFGLNIPADHMNGYNYWDPRIGIHKQPHKDFVDKSVIELGTCGAKGVAGPTPIACAEAYNNTEVLQNVKVLEKAPFKGMQIWKVPNEGYYTIIAKGAGGGLGSGGVGSSRGAMVISVLELHKDEEIYMLVGQSGQHACIKSMGYRDEDCEPKEKNQTTTNDKFQSKTHRVKNIVIEDGAGGGGGGSFVYLLNSAFTAVPLLIAGGGGGLGIGRYLDDDHQHGRGIDDFRAEETGVIHGDPVKAAGPGGGWNARLNTFQDMRFGGALQEGGIGGYPCYAPKGLHGQGGFGGGGGGCSTGGGGGGSVGGDTNVNSTNGEGGSSYINYKRSVMELSTVYGGANSGPGSVVIIPAIQGCGCDYRCVSLDEFRSIVACICPEGWKLRSDNYTACDLNIGEPLSMKWVIIFFVVVTVLLVFALACLILILYNRYQRKKQAALRHQMLLEQDLQLSRLRHTADDSALTNFNPNYGCDGILNGNVDVKSLPQVARESLRLVKALGQGAFGEVYQGLYRHRDGDAVEMPVAVKTLPEMSTGQAEADFLMEAAIMAKFNHPNIVHLIGVCFDRHPRFIVLELLAGGDLKNFLREGRNKPERPSPLTMKDLVFCALDVAKGCRYMESKRFIHRDIAARNCLLSSKGPGRVVKIADFGMARDIYRSDYYRKGGKAMLPIKWMPPEAFLDGIFTSKTDVWSFGVLLWEVFSLGLMPYTGLPNRDVMQLVTGGGRLDAPPGCPQAIYKIMKDCWNPTPEERPAFSNILERLTTCTQDLDVMNAPLPSFFRPPSNERDQTIMRPPGNDDFCLQVPSSSDYLIPLPGPRSAVERLLSEATGVTLSETASTYTAPKTTSPAIPPKHTDGSWETSFMVPKPMLEICNHNNHINGCDSTAENEQNHVDKSLISLDTPQQTPTTIKPPMSFGGPITNHNNTENTNNKNSDASPITLDPAALTKQGTSYANVRMLNSINSATNPTPVNGNNNLNGHATESEKCNGALIANSIDKAPPPFTIQGFNDRFISNENHSEISC